MKNLKELIEIIENRKSMYLVRSTIFDLYSLLLGIEISNPEFEDIKLLREFQSWIAKKYKINTSQSWASVLSFFSVGDEQALDLFFKEWRQFLENSNDYSFRKDR